MRAMQALARLLVPALLIPVIACANGAGLEPGYNELDELEGAGGDGGEGEGGDGGSDWGASSSVSSTSAGTGGGEGGAGGGQGGVDEGGRGGEPACTYEAPAPCNRAEQLPSISGDVGAESVTRRGSTSRWFKINITDDVWSTDRVSYTVRLSSPPGMNWDLYVYPGDEEGPNCFASGIKGYGSPEEVVTGEWSDVIIDDNNLWLSIEVRYASGTACGSDAAWTLTVEGNTADRP